MKKLTKRVFDIGMCLLVAPLLGLLMLVVAVLVRVTSPGPILYWSKRVGRHNRIFLMPKFRTMRVDTPQLATHLMQQPELYLTSVGGTLRRLSLDELPQLWSILVGDMSIVGPRPALFNQDDLVALRTEHGVHELTPGLTGWAQINGRDELSIAEKVKFDVEYRQRQSLLFDLKIILATAVRVLRSQGVKH